MHKIFIIALLVTLLNAQNPKVYAALGDVIYDNVDNIEKLKDINAYQSYINDIAEYVAEVRQAKEVGLLIESSANHQGKKSYLSTLRRLSKKNDFFIRSVQSNYKNAIDSNNSELFSQIVNSGLIDTNRNKEQILDYYFQHAEDINASGIIQKYLDEDAKLKAKRDAAAARYKTKKMREAEKIKRIRENDLEAQRALEKRLQEEVNKKKLEIRINQKRELAQ
jgi:hypothetical protein